MTLPLYAAFLDCFDTNFFIVFARMRLHTLNSGATFLTIKLGITFCQPLLYSALNYLMRVFFSCAGITDMRYL